MTRSSIVYIDPTVLERVEARISETLETSRAGAVLLVDKSGIVLASAGEPPLHPEQFAAMAAGVYSAMNVMIKASRTEDFVVHLPQNNAHFQFQYVDLGLFLCGFYTDADDEEAVRSGLRQLAVDARQSIAGDQGESGKPDNVNFIEEKLNELFGD